MNHLKQGWQNIQQSPEEVWNHSKASMWLWHLQNTSRGLFTQTEDNIIITFHRAEFYSFPSASVPFYFRWPFIITLRGGEARVITFTLQIRKLVLICWKGHMTSKQINHSISDIFWLSIWPLFSYTTPTLGIAYKYCNSIGLTCKKENQCGDKGAIVF